MQPDTKLKCTANSKRTGKPCGSYAMKGRRVCRMHGGTNNGPPKDNQNAKTHGAYSKYLDDDDMAAKTEEEAALDSLDDDIKANAIMKARGFKLSISRNPLIQQLGLKLIENAIGRAAKLKMYRLEIKKATASDENKPLPWNLGDDDDN